MGRGGRKGWGPLVLPLGVLLPILPKGEFGKGCSSVSPSPRDAHPKVSKVEKWGLSPPPPTPRAESFRGRSAFLCRSALPEGSQSDPGALPLSLSPPLPPDRHRPLQSAELIWGAGPLNDCNLAPWWVWGGRESAFQRGNIDIYPPRKLGSLLFLRCVTGVLVGKGWWF